MPNSAGGYAWPVDDWTRLDRFLILGAEGGTYYIGEHDLVKRNHDALVRCIQADGVCVLNRIVEISDSGRAPKHDPAIFALALVAAHGNPAARALAFQNLRKACRMGTHLFQRAEDRTVGFTGIVVEFLAPDFLNDYPELRPCGGITNGLLRLQHFRQEADVRGWERVERAKGFEASTSTLAR